MPLEQPRLGARLFRDEIAFFRNVVGSPRKTGAVSPSGRWLARAMAAEVDPESDGPVIELGPGTGVFTRALIERGVAAERLVLIEFNQDFCAHLQREFPDVTLIRGDAFTVGRHVQALGLGAPSAVVSGLPLLLSPVDKRVRLIEESLAAGRPDMPFVQFSYAAQPPVPAGLGRYRVRLARRVWLNFPPAAAWVYTAA